MVIFSRVYLEFKLFYLFIFCTSLSLNSQNAGEVDNLINEFNDYVYTDFIKAEQIGLEALEVSERVNSIDGKFQSYISLIRIYTFKKQYKLAKIYIDRALKIEEDITIDFLKIDLYNFISFVENNDLNYTKAFFYSEKAIQMALKLEDSLRISKGYVNKGSLFISQQNFDEAKKSLYKAEIIAQNNKYNSVLLDAYLSLAKINYNINKDSAIFYYNNALKNAKISNNKFKQAGIYADLGFLYLYYSETEGVKDLLYKSRILSEEVGCKVTLHNIYYSFGYYYELLGDYKESIKNYEIALSDYGNYVSPIQLSNAYIMTSSAYSHNSDYVKAYDYQQRYIILNDSIFNINKAKEFDNIRTKYEVEKKDNIILLLEKENEIAETRKKWLGTSAIFLLSLLLGSFLFYRQKTKTQRIILEQEQKSHKIETEKLKKEKELNKVKSYIEGQDKERNRIAKELHDGIGGKLASINLTLSHINSELKIEAIKDVNKNLSGSFEELRALSHSLSTSAINDKAFESLLAELKVLYEKSNALDIEISVFPENTFSELVPKLKHQLYRVIQELLANVAKHANAKKVEVSFNLHEDVLVVIFNDDGCGFDPKENNNGIGIKNIKERISTLLGKVTIDSFLNKGTHVVMEFPVKTNKEKNA